MRHLVTGGSGFVGNLIAHRLLERGEQVRVLDLWEDPTRAPGIEFVRCDIRDRSGVARAMKGIDVVHHNVALVPLTRAGSGFWSVNVEGSRLAAEEAANAGVKMFVHMSSSAIFGVPHSLPVMTDSPPDPVEIYGRAKLAGERAVTEICRQNNLPLIVVRPRTVLGATRLGIFQILFEWISEDRDVYVIGPGDTLFQLVHAHDLMDAYVQALTANRPGVYNVGTDRFGTLREGLEHLIAQVGSRSRVVSLPERLSIGALKLLDVCRLSPLQPWHYLTYGKAFYFDVAPLHALGWKARYSNDEMLLESYQWFLANRSQLAQRESGSPHRKPVVQRLLRIVKRLS